METTELIDLLSRDEVSRHQFKERTSPMRQLQAERLKLLNQIAIRQMNLLLEDRGVRKLENKKL